MTLGAEQGPTVGLPWHSCRHISPHPLRTVLELGSGAGLTGLAICKVCHPRAFIFSDCHTRVLEQLRGNILLNSLSLEPNTTTSVQHPGHDTRTSGSPKVTVAQLDWDTVTAPQLAAFQPDVVIAAGTTQPSAQGRGQWAPQGSEAGNDETSGRVAVGLQCDIKAQGVPLKCPKAPLLLLEKMLTS